MRPARVVTLPQKKTVHALRSTQTSTRFNLDRCALWLGLGLVSAFLLQDFSGFHWRWLERLQADGTYRQLSGLVLVAFLAHQWYLSVLRNRGLMRKAGTLVRSHKLIGALAPAIFYAHSQHLGYAYLSVLSGVFFAILLGGLVQHKVIGLRKSWLQALWITTHVGLAVVLLILVGDHVYISYAYR